jgi:hypothetical protein
MKSRYQNVSFSTAEVLLQVARLQLQAVEVDIQKYGKLIEDIEYNKQNQNWKLILGEEEFQGIEQALTNYKQIVEQATTITKPTLEAEITQLEAKFKKVH